MAQQAEAQQAEPEAAFKVFRCQATGGSAPTTREDQREDQLLAAALTLLGLQHELPVHDGHVGVDAAGKRRGIDAPIAVRRRDDPLVVGLRNHGSGRTGGRRRVLLRGCFRGGHFRLAGRQLRRCMQRTSRIEAPHVIAKTGPSTAALRSLLRERLPRLAQCVAVLPLIAQGEVL